jgi:hypothetical protein
MSTRKFSRPAGAVTPEAGFVPAIYVPRRVVRRPARRGRA